MTQQSPPRSGFSKALIALIVTFAFLLAAFGVMQPLLLQELGLAQRGSLDVADVVSILVTVVSILVALLGLGIYFSVRDRIADDAKNLMKEAQGTILAEINRGVSRVKLNQALFCWLHLEPLLLDGPRSHGDVERTRDLVRSGASVSRQAIAEIEKAMEYDSTKEELDGCLLEAKVNLVFFQASLLRLGYAKDPQGVLGEVFTHLPSLVEATKGTPVTETFAQLVESVSWAELCCRPSTDPEWTEARDRVRGLLAQGLLPRARTVARYQRFFGAAVLG
jgi:hypothetical protein